MTDFARTVDIRKIELHQDKYPTVQRTFESLKVGEKMELINDHDMTPLFKFKFPLDFPGQYEWSYIQEGPDAWIASVTKIGGLK